MLRHPFALRFTTAFLTGALLAGPVFPSRALAQPADPAAAATLAPDPAAAPADQADPPAKVGRLARTRGTVSYHPGNAESWDRAQANWPLTTGDAIWTEPDGRAELELAGGVIQLQGGSEFSIDRLDDRSLGATLRQGEIRLRLPGLAPGESLRVQTPRGLVTIATPGRYEIVAGNVENPTRVMVFQGSAELGENLRLGARQVASISGADPFTTATEPAGPDPFRSMAPLPIVHEARSVPIPRTVAQMPGGAELAAYGAWEPTPEYGAVWYPQVAAGWTPYRQGHWAFVAPWGWTWIDDAPWGFAPFHYGRWLQFGGRWAWAPGGYAQPGYAEPVYAEPIYAPALVTFFGVGLGIGAVIGAGPYGGNIGWCPLGPREAYHPWYRASPNYVRNVNIANVSNVTNITTINNNTSIQSFRNRAAATQIAAAAMVASSPVRPIGRAVPGALLASARPLTGALPIAPAAATAGMTPNLVRRFGAPAGAVKLGAVNPGALSPGAITTGAIGAGAVGAAAIAAARRSAPGPAIRAASPIIPTIAPALRATSPEATRPVLPGPVVARPAGPADGLPRAAIQGARPAFGVAPALAQPALPQIGLQRPSGIGLPLAGPAAIRPTRPNLPAANAFRTPGQAPPAVPTVQTPSLATVPQPRVAPAAPVFHPPPPQVQQPTFRPPPPAAAFHPPPQIQQPAFRPPPQAAQVFHAPPPQIQQPIFRPPQPAQVFRAPPPPPQPAFRPLPPPSAPRPAPPARDPRDRLHP